MKFKLTPNNFSIRKFIITWICGFFPILCFPQTDVREYIQLDTVLSFPTEEIIGNQEPIYCVYQNNLIFTNYSIYKQSDSICVYKIDFTSHLIDTIVLYEEGITEYLKEKSCYGFDFIAFTNSYLVLALSNQLFVYTPQQEKYTLCKKVNFPRDYSDNIRFISENKLLLADAYYPRNPQTEIAVYDIVEQKYIQKIHPYFNHILCSYINHRDFIDAVGGQILTTHRNEYAFILYDSLLNRTDSLSWNASNWVGFPERLEKKIYKKYGIHDAGDICAKIRPYYKKMDNMTGLRFLSQDKILIDYRLHETVNPKNTTFFDVWEKENGTWTLKHERLTDDWVGSYRFKNDTLTNKSFAIGRISGNKILVVENKLAVLQSFGTNFNPVGLSENDFFEKWENFVEEHRFCVQFYIFSHQF